MPARSPAATPTSISTAGISHQDLVKLRKFSFENSFKKIRSRSIPEEHQLVITNITVLQQDFLQKSNEKRDLESLQSESLDTLEAEDDNLSTRKRGTPAVIQT